MHIEQNVALSVTALLYTKELLGEFNNANTDINVEKQKVVSEQNTTGEHYNGLIILNFVYIAFNSF